MELYIKELGIKVKDGFGIEKISDGTVYIGEWRKGHKNGEEN